MSKATGLNPTHASHSLPTAVPGARRWCAAGVSALATYEELKLHRTTICSLWSPDLIALCLCLNTASEADYRPAPGWEQEAVLRKEGRRLASYIILAPPQWLAPYRCENKSRK